MLASSSEHTLHISDLGKTPVRCPNCGSQKIDQQATAFAAVTPKRADLWDHESFVSVRPTAGLTERIRTEESVNRGLPPRQAVCVL